MIKRICNRCFNEVLTENDIKLKKEYPFYCPTCDENKYSFEVIKQEQKNEIYIVNTCNDWKTNDSMNKEIVTTSWQKAYSKVLELIKENNLTVGNQELLETGDYLAINVAVSNIYIERWED